MRHLILKDFKGSQDGTRSEAFIAGTTVELTPYLAEIVVREGWARQVADEATAILPGIDNKAITTDGEHPAAGRRRRVMKPAADPTGDA